MRILSGVAGFVALACTILLLWVPLKDRTILEDAGGGRLIWFLLAATFVGMTVVGKVSSWGAFVVLSVLYMLLFWRVMVLECGGGVCLVGSGGGIVVVVGLLSSIAGMVFAFLGKR